MNFNIRDLFSKNNLFYLFFVLHGFVLFCIFIFPQIPKFIHFLPDKSLLIWFIPFVFDLLFILGLEFFVLGCCSFFKPNIQKWLRFMWGIVLFPLVFLSVIDFGFFLKTGSVLEWKLFYYSLAHFEEIYQVIRGELTWFYLGMLLISFPLGMLFSFLGWKIKSSNLRWKKSLIQVSLGLTLLMIFGIWNSVNLFHLFKQEIRENILSKFVKGVIISSLSEESSRNLKEVPKFESKFFETLKFEPLNNYQRKNVIFLILESFRASATSVYNSSFKTTPFLEQLAMKSYKIDRLYSSIPHTTKSLVAILCGIPPNFRFTLTEGAIGGLPPRCLPTLLKKFGYRSAFFQSFFRDFENRPVFVKNMGFDEFFAKEDIPKLNWEIPNYAGIEERALIQPVIDWIKKNEAPYFLTILTSRSHHSYMVPSYFEKKKFNENAKFNDFLNTVRYQDFFLEEFFSALKKEKLLENTLFFLVGDHGEGFREHKLSGHDMILYEEGIHVLGLVYDPDHPAGGKLIKGNRQQMDLLPTLFDLLGLNLVQGNLFGVSLFSPVENRVHYTSCYYNKGCLAKIWENKKFIFNYQKRDNQYYDLNVDPLEQMNIIGQLNEPEIESYIVELENFRDKTRSFHNYFIELNENSNIWSIPHFIPNEINFQFDKKLRILGHEEFPKFRKGRKQNIILYFQTLETMHYNWRIKIKIVDIVGRSWPLKLESILNEKYPFNTWIPEKKGRVDFEFKTPRGVSSGKGFLQIALLDPWESRPAKVIGNNGKGKARYVNFPIYIE